MVLTDGTNYETKKSLKNDVAGGTEDVCYKLYITAKAKGYVRFLLVSVLQKPTETYPCHLKDEINEEEYNNIKNSTDFIEKRIWYLQLIIPQYFISNKSGIWSLSLIVHSKG